MHSPPSNRLGLTSEAKNIRRAKAGKQCCGFGSKTYGRIQKTKHFGSGSGSSSTSKQVGKYGIRNEFETILFLTVPLKTKKLEVAQTSPTFYKRRWKWAEICNPKDRDTQVKFMFKILEKIHAWYQTDADPDPNPTKSLVRKNSFRIQNTAVKRGKCLPLVIRGPGQILDGPRYGLELILEYVLLVHRVPDPHLPCTNGFSSSITIFMKIWISCSGSGFNWVTGSGFRQAKIVPSKWKSEEISCVKILNVLCGV